MAYRSVLIIEDEEHLSDALRAEFIANKYSVVIASDGESGLKIALTMQPDIVLLDIYLHEMNGLLVLNRMRDDSWGKTAKVLIMTNNDSDDNKSRALYDEVDGFIVKANVTPKDIVEQVKELLDKS